MISAAACRPAAVLGIVEDRTGNLWVGTDGGLSRFDPRTQDVYELL